MQGGGDLPWEVTCRGVVDGISMVIHMTRATVRLDRDPAGDAQDGYGRILRYVMLASGENVNATLIRDGYARTIRTFPYSRPREFLQLEAQARRGRWAERSR